MKSRGVIVLVMASVVVAQAFGRFTWGLVLPSARDDVLGGSNTLAGLLGTLNVSAYMVGTLGMAWAATKASLTGLMRVGLLISTSSLAAAAFAPNGVVLGVAVFAMGIGGAIIWIPSPAIAAKLLPPHRSGQAVGLISSGIGLGILFAGQLSNRLATGEGDAATPLWQRVYRVEFAIALVVVVAVFVFLRVGLEAPVGRSGGLGGFGALRTVDGWRPLTVAYACFGFAYILVIGFLVARLEDDAGFTADQAAAMFAVVGASTAAGGAGLGLLADRIGVRTALMGSMSIFGTCTLVLLTGSQPWVTLAAIGVGITFTGTPGLILTHVVNHTDDETYGPALAAATLAFGITQMISPQVGGAIADVTGSFTAVFALSAVVSFVGATAATRLPRRSTDQTIVEFDVPQ